MLLAMPIAPPASADEVEDTIQEALQAYRQRDLGGARQALEQASQLILERRAERLAAILPPAMAGWTAEDGDSRSGGLGLFGGGLQASRTYRRGEEEVDLQVIGDSPLVAQIMPFLGSSAMAGLMGRTVRVGRLRALQTHDGKIMMVVANRFLVTAAGDAPIEDKMRYAAAIDTAALEAL